MRAQGSSQVKNPIISFSHTFVLVGDVKKRQNSYNSLPYSLCPYINVVFVMLQSSLNAQFTQTQLRINSCTLSCQIETTGVLLGTVFSMPTHDKSNESISNFQQRLVTCEHQYWPEYLWHRDMFLKHQYCHQEALKKNILIRTAWSLSGSKEYQL